MTCDPIPTPRPGASSNGQRAAVRVASFPRAAVVQLVSGDALAPNAVVADLHPASVTVTSTRVAATDGDIAWSWLVNDLEAVVHGADAPWTIFVVPGIADFGVAVPAEQVTEFRNALAGLPGVRVRHQQGSVPRDPAPSVPPPPRPPAPPLASLAAPAAVVEVVLPLVADAVVPSAAPTPAPELAAGERPPLFPPAPLVASPAATITEPVAVVAPPVVAGAPPVVAVAAPPVVAEAPTVHNGPALVLGAVVVEQAPKAGRWRLRERHEAAKTDMISPQATLTGLDARGISAWFGTHQVLDRVSLEMAAGEVTALIGPSGCGKSTFLRILNRMHEMIPSASLAGEVLLDGHDIYDASRKLTDARREIGMVFQKPNPFPAMSIYDNVLASLRLTGVKAGIEVKDEIVESCLTKAGLWAEVRDRLRQPGGGLSGGQQQRLCIARALAIRPRVLLMDEPCSALDPTSTRRIEETIMQLVSEVTIVIVTHNMQQAARVSNRCAFFLAEQGTPGVIVEHGPTKAMFGSPQDPRTNDYVMGRFG